MAKRRALVLAGGGARGSFQVGMLLELVVNQGLDFQILRGVSVGALNAGFLAQAKTTPTGDSHANLVEQVKALRDLWRHEIRGNHSVYKDRTGGFAGLAAGADSLYSIEPLKDKMETHLSPREMRESGRDFAVGTVSLVSGEYQEWRPGDSRFRDRILASASIPVVFPFVDFPAERDVLVDGGVRNITPLSSAFRADPPPDEIYVLLSSKVIREDGDLERGAVQRHDYDEWDDNFLGTGVSGIDVLERTVDILTDEVYLDDVRGAIEWNGVLKSYDALDRALTQQDAQNSAAVKAARKKLKDALGNKRYVPIHVLAPRKWFGPKNFSTEFSPEEIQRAIRHGRNVAKDSAKWVVP